MILACSYRRLNVVGVNEWVAYLQGCEELDCRNATGASSCNNSLKEKIGVVILRPQYRTWSWPCVMSRSILIRFLRRDGTYLLDKAEISVYFIVYNEFEKL